MESKIRATMESEIRAAREARSLGRHFAIIFVLGGPGAGKGTLCAHLAQKYNFAHYSIGDNLRIWMRENQGTSLAVTIQEKLDRQGFLTPDDLNPFIGRAIKEAIAEDQAGIIVDGFPRNADQLASFEHWPFQEELPIKVEEEKWLPDVVLLVNVDKEKARERYLARGRDKNDSADKFENRYAEYLREGPPVEQAYRSAGVLLEIDANGTKRENVDSLEETLDESELWRLVVEERKWGHRFLV